MAPQKKLVLALNSGSSSLKASLMEGDSYEIANFLGERLHTEHAVVHLPGETTIRQPNMDHETALSFIIDYLKDQNMLDGLVAIGHRVVHGGTIFKGSAVIGDKEYQQLKSITHLAPL